MVDNEQEERYNNSIHLLMRLTAAEKPITGRH
jgi:hypothetical protein